MDYRPDELEKYPGYFIRRLQQVAVAAFMGETQEWGITPVQFGALSAVARNPEIDQRTLAEMIRFDTSTIGSVLDRLEKRGLLTRGASASDRRVRLLRVTQQGQALLQVVDNGPGIDVGERDAVFERFYRSEATQAVEGSGLGLSIVREIARVHGASIALSEAPDGGLVVSVRFPMLEAALA